MEAYYRKINNRMWIDEKFCCLSAPQPNAQSLFIYLMTGPHTSAIPGIFIMGEAMLAEAIGWEIEDLRRCMKELTDAGMVFFDKKARVVWMPNAIKYNPPQNPNVVQSWGRGLALIPNCAAKDGFKKKLVEFLAHRGKESRGVDYVEAFEEGKSSMESFGESLPESLPDKDKDKLKYKYEEKKKKKLTTRTRAVVDSPAQEIIDYYNEVFGEYQKQAWKLTPDLKRKIEGRMKSFDVETLKRAVANLRKSAFHCGENDRCKFYATPEFIFRNDSKVQEWSNLKTVAAGREDRRHKIVEWVQEDKNTAPSPSE